MTTMPTAAQINALLPQTQCRECGFSGCLPYAQALADSQAPINLCAPGGAIVIHDLAQLLRQPEIPPAKSQSPALAWIDEAVCIGCTACIRACPVDAIMGASKQMHTVLADECTGCGLCVAPCPVDCIYMRPTAAAPLPQARVLSKDSHAAERFQAAQHAQARYENQIARKQRIEAERKQKAAAYQAKLAAHPRQPENEGNVLERNQNEPNKRNEFPKKQNERNELQQNPNEPNKSQHPPKSPSLSPADLIAQAMQRAQKQSNERIVPSNHSDFRQNQIREAQQRATYRRYQRDAQYGTPAEKAAAIEWLRQHKAEQEAREAANQQAA
ncbi:RnfABCDGE type electron transport complex subunit B [Kingella oralis]|uniref:RnfABCDGE type electron transport complex subunit B n=1 Tax=Kingella oralis TaxID=505 RepID=UPI002D802EB2|nr:RnfABCDGE type electron transport complex subunit B [Kingella oralis]